MPRSASDVATASQRSGANIIAAYVARFFAVLAPISFPANLLARPASFGYARRAKL